MKKVTQREDLRGVRRLLEELEDFSKGGEKFKARRETVPLRRGL